MKKLTILLIFLFSFILSYGQIGGNTNSNVNAQDLRISRWVIYRGDTIDLLKLNTFNYISYSADSTSWHVEPQSSDIYIRFSTDSTNWSNPSILKGSTFNVD